MSARARAAHQGFNRNFAGKNGTMYGHGVYFAVLASYSAQVAAARACTRPSAVAGLAVPVPYGAQAASPRAAAEPAVPASIGAHAIAPS